MPAAKCMSGLKFVVVGDHGYGRGESDWARWISLRGGQVQDKLQPNTTHVIIEPSMWEKRPRPSIIENVIKRKDLNLVTAEYVEQYFKKNKAPGGKNVPPDHDFRKRAGNKRFPSASSKQEEKEARKEQKEAEKEEKRIAKEKEKEAKKLAKQQEQEEARARKRPRSALAAELRDHTAHYATAAKKAKIAKPMPKKGLMAEEVRKQEAARKAARQETLSDGYHLFIDDTGFSYDIRLFRVQLEFNLNQTLRLKLYESDGTKPHRYAVAKLHYGSLMDEDVKELIAGPGANFPTAYREFKNTFKDLTKVDWDDRMTFSRTRKDPSIEEPTTDQAGVKVKTGQTAEQREVWGGARSKEIDADKQAAFFAAKFRWQAPFPGQPEGMMNAMNAQGGQAKLGLNPPSRVTTTSAQRDASVGAEKESRNVFMGSPSEPPRTPTIQRGRTGTPYLPGGHTPRARFLPCGGMDGSADMPAEVDNEAEMQDLDDETYESDSGYDADADGSSSQEPIGGDRNNIESTTSHHDLPTANGHEEVETDEQHFTAIDNESVVNGVPGAAIMTPPDDRSQLHALSQGVRSESFTHATGIDAHASESLVEESKQAQGQVKPQPVQGGRLFTKQYLAIRMLTIPQQPTISEALGREPITSFEKNLNQMALSQRALKQKVRAAKKRTGF
ncbi:Hypothetical protein D9617_3g020560 [Elsinoe fawcettii]|nr:Hypothetical protein D9617_3g020560 [Elsinoe fawcettii]